MCKTLNKVYKDGWAWLKSYRAIYEFLVIIYGFELVLIVQKSILVSKYFTIFFNLIGN